MKKEKVGIEEFITHKLAKAHTIDEISSMLKNSGFSEDEIERGVLNVKKHHKTFHQDVVASNNFFPPLDKNMKKNGNGLRNDFYLEHSHHRGLFAGRIRRKDFIVAILFLFSLLFSLIIVFASFVDALRPEIWDIIGKLFSTDQGRALLILLPVIFAPFTLIFISLITRRLHDLDMPGVFSFFYLSVFIYPFSNYASSWLIILDIALFILFIFLLLKKAVPETNKYGKSPASHGSTFSKILNLK